MVNSFNSGFVKLLSVILLLIMDTNAHKSWNSKMTVKIKK